METPDEIAAALTELRLKFSPSSPRTVFGLEEQRRELYTAISGTVFRAQSSSVLLLGPHGCGKSTLVRSVLEEISGTYSSQSSAPFVQVWVDGLVHESKRSTAVAIAHALSLNLDSQSDLLSSNQVMDQMEKRVRSRFEHHHLYFPPPQPHHILQALPHLLHLHLPSTSPCPPSPPPAALAYRTEYNRRLHAALNDEQVVGVVSRNADLGRPMAWFRSLALLVAARLSPAHPFVTPDDFTAAAAALAAPALPRLLNGLSIAELVLLIAAKRLHLQLAAAAPPVAHSPLTVSRLLAEYAAFAAHNSNLHQLPRLSKHALANALERLVHLHLLAAASDARPLPHTTPLSLLVDSAALEELLREQTVGVASAIAQYAVSTAAAQPPHPTL